MNLQDAVKRLGEADARLAAAVGTPATLASDRDRATALSELGERLLEDAPEDVIEAFAFGMSQIVDAQLEHFPENIFWDVDYLAASLVTLADAATIATTCDTIAKLQAQFGRHSLINFRYVHDFTYGFDWAKWVIKAPETRAHVGPFDREFVDYLRQRGDELVTLIENDDEKYPKLPDGTPRNPFGFSREPAHERELGRALAARGLVPVEAWRMDATPVWDRPFAELREELAEQLNLLPRDAAARGAKR